MMRVYVRKYTHVAFALKVRIVATLDRVRVAYA